MTKAIARHSDLDIEVTICEKIIQKYKKQTNVRTELSKDYKPISQKKSCVSFIFNFIHHRLVDRVTKKIIKK